MIPGVSQNLVSLGIALMLFWGAFALFALWKVNGRRTRNAFALLLLLGAFLHGSFVFSKGDGPQNAPRRRTNVQTPMSDFSPAQKQARFVLSGCSTNAAFDLAMPANAVVHWPWLVRGAASDGFFLSSTNAFFRLGTNEVRFARIDSSGMIGFSPRRRDAEPIEMPDSGDDAFLAPLRTSLGIVPEPNGARAGVAESCVWHAETADGLLVTWQEALADREPSNAVIFQVELRQTGDFVYRYDIPAGTVVSNFVIGAQNEGGGETALIGDGGLGCTEGHRCATVWDGATEHPLCERLAPDGILRGPLRFELRWTSITDLDPENPDNDSDGLSNRDEVCRYHTDPSQSDSDLDGIPDGTEVADDSDPLDPDEDGDGIPDGVSPSVWASNPLWGNVAGKTNLVLTADVQSVPGVRMSAICIGGSLTVPLVSGTNSIPLWLPLGESIRFQTLCSAGASVRLAAESTRTGEAFWIRDPNGVFSDFRGTASGEMAFPTLDLRDVDGDSEAFDRCLHGGKSYRDLLPVFSPASCGFSPDDVELDGLQRLPTGLLRLSVPSEPGYHVFGSAVLRDGFLVSGGLSAEAGAHICEGGQDCAYCEVCGAWHGLSEGCLHSLNECPSAVDPDADCTCHPFVRIDFDDDDADGTDDRDETGPVPGNDDVQSWVLLTENECCCSGADDARRKARISGIPPSLRIFDEDGYALEEEAIVDGKILVEAVEASPTLEGAVFRYDVLDETNGTIRSLSVGCTAAGVLLRPDIDCDGILSPADTFERNRLPDGVWTIGKTVVPISVAIRNEIPSNAVLRLQLSCSSEENLGLPGVSNGRIPVSANTEETISLDVSGEESSATIDFSVSGGGCVLDSDILSIRTLDTTLPERWIWRLASDRAAYAFPQAPANVWFRILSPDGEDVVYAANDKSLPVPVGLALGDYPVHANFPGVWSAGDSFAGSTGCIHVVDAKIGEPYYGLKRGSASRVRIDLDGALSTPNLAWRLDPILENGPRFFLSETDMVPKTSIEHASSVWVSAGEENGTFGIEAYVPQNTNIVDYACLDVFDFTIEPRLAILRESAAPTETYRLVSDRTISPGWSLSTDATMTWPRAVISASENGDYSNWGIWANRIWVNPSQSLIEYTVTAVHPTYANVRDTATLRVCDIRLEPITTETYGSARNYNPCAMVVGETARFKLTVDPAPFVPDSDITWIPLSGNHVSYDGDHGRIFEAEAVSTGAQTMAVHIENYAGPAPEIEFTVFPTRHAIPCHFVFVRDSYGNLPSEVTNMQTFAESWISAVNEIYRQVDMEFFVASDVCSSIIPTAFNIESDDNSSDDSFSDLFVPQQGIRGIRIFVINAFSSYLDPRCLKAITMTTADQGHPASFGIAIPSYMPAQSLAHEIGHACGLEDIYWDVEDLVDDGEPHPLPLTHAVHSFDLPEDWTGSVGYYSSNMNFTDLISRLLMNGHPTMDCLGTDIPAGSVYGIGYDDSGDWEISLQTIGLDSLYKTPYTLGGEFYE